MPARTHRCVLAGKPFALRLRDDYLTCDSGPLLTGNCEVFSAWIPACCSPLNGVTIGAVAPGSQPMLNGTLGLFHHRPMWNWWVGAYFVVAPGDTENVSLLKTPRTVADPEPDAPARTSV